MVAAEFERIVSRLRIKIRLSGLENDEYRNIIYIENYILKYGKQVVHDTLTALSFASDEDEIKILSEILQTQKDQKDLFLYERLKPNNTNREAR